MKLEIRYATVGEWNENSYILEYNQQSILIDPGDDFETLDTYFQKNNTKHIAILNTHGHFDHIGAVEDFRNKYQIPFYIHSKDKNILHQANLLMRFAGQKHNIKIPKIDYFLDEQNSFQFYDKNIFIHHAPGHSQGSVCLEIDNILFSGDILFKDSIGRTDLPGGNKALLSKSINFIINNFKDYTIYPGHGLPFVLNEEIITNINKLI